MKQEMQKWLDGSVNGIVYFTFGSSIAIKTIPVNTLEAIYEFLSKLAPIRVLMKIVDKSHKNVRAFITHGGLMDTQEALYFGVPMIRNVAVLSSRDIAVKLDFDNITIAFLDKALNKVLYDPKKNAQYYSKLFKDRPRNAMDTAIFWIEYVIVNGPNALKSSALEVPWWQL